MPSTTAAFGIARDQRDREIVRRTAELLATDLPLKEVFAQLCALLARFVDASDVFIVLVEGGIPHIAYMLDHGSVSAPSDAQLRDKSEALAVLESGKAALKRERRETESTVFVPLKFGNETIGVLAVRSEHPAAYDQQDVELLETCAMYVAVRVYVARQSSAKAALEDLASHDGLTGVANRRAFDARLSMEWDRAVRSRAPLSLVMADIDYFKLFNDGYGHVAGDGCLQQVAHAMAGAMARPADLFARYGGEEFVALLPESDNAGAVIIAEKMRAAVNALGLPHESSSLKRVSVSLGVATIIPAGGEFATLVQSADKLLYAAKAAGRNRVVAQYHQSQTPQVDQLRRVKHNLPLQLTDFVGRDSEIADLKGALAAARLVTLAGPGGIGKTRLSIRVASETLETYPHGIWFIELALLSEPASIPTAIAAVLGLQTSQSNVLETIVSSLRAKRTLLVFDNCEHVIEASARIADTLLRECPGISILASSREPLGVPGEVTYRVPSLALPPPGTSAASLDPDKYDALRLFAARASASQQHFAITPKNAQTVAQICRRLDGIALAIELAAARLKSMTIEELARALDDRFRLLTGGSRTLLPRQQTLRALIDWSFTLLRPAEKAVMLRLSMFAGGWTLEAASEVCSDATIESWEVRDMLAQLVDKSLVNADQDGAQTRYRFGESTRDYARELFASLEDASQFRDRHVRYYASLAEISAATWPAMPTRTWLPPLKKEDDNFRTALEWSIGERQDTLTGTALVLALVPYWDESGVRREALRWLETTLVLAGQTPRMLARLKLAIATALRRVNVDTERQTQLAHEAHAAFVASGDDHGVAWSLVALAIATLQAEIQAPDSIRQLKEAERIFRALDDKLGLIDAVNGLGIAYETDSAVAMAMYTEALNTARTVGHDLLVARSLANMGHIYLNEGNVDHALSSIQEALAIEERYGARSAMAWDSSTLACIEYTRGNFEGARRYALGAIDECVVQGSIWLLRECLISIALIALEGGEPERAELLLGYIDAMNDLPPLQPLVNTLYQSLRTAVQAAIPAADDRLRLHSKGASMQIDEAVALAKEHSGVPFVSGDAARRQDIPI